MATLDEDEHDVDATLKALMQEQFGPARAVDETADPETCVRRGLDEVEALSQLDLGADGFRWLDEITDGLLPSVLHQPRRCFTCGTPSPASSCAKCGVASYCNRDCQTKDWSAKTGAWGGHKKQCAAYKSLGQQQQVESAEERRLIVEKALASIRLYMCPFAIFHGSGYGTRAPRGCVFVQFGCSVDELALPAPRACDGRPLETGDRSALVHFATLEEYDAEIAQSDKRLSAVREALVRAIEGHDDRQHVVVLLRAACGYTAVILQRLVPEWRVARQLADEYANRDCLQINLDDL